MRRNKQLNISVGQRFIQQRQSLPRQGQQQQQRLCQMASKGSALPMTINGAPSLTQTLSPAYRKFYKNLTHTCDDSIKKTSMIISPIPNKQQNQQQQKTTKTIIQQQSNVALNDDENSHNVDGNKHNIDENSHIADANNHNNDDSQYENQQGFMDTIEYDEIKKRNIQRQKKQRQKQSITAPVAAQRAKTIIKIDNNKPQPQPQHQPQPKFHQASLDLSPSTAQLLQSQSLLRLKPMGTSIDLADACVDHDDCNGNGKSTKGNAKNNTNKEISPKSISPMIKISSPQQRQQSNQQTPLHPAQQQPALIVSTLSPSSIYPSPLKNQNLSGSNIMSRSILRSPCSSPTSSFFLGLKVINGILSQNQKTSTQHFQEQIHRNFKSLTMMIQKTAIFFQDRLKTHENELLKVMQSQIHRIQQDCQKTISIFNKLITDRKNNLQINEAREESSQLKRQLIELNKYNSELKGEIKYLKRLNNEYVIKIENDGRVVTDMTRKGLKQKQKIRELTEELLRLRLLQAAANKQDVRMEDSINKHICKGMEDGGCQHHHKYNTQFSISSSKDTANYDHHDPENCNPHNINKFPKLMHKNKNKLSVDSRQRIQRRMTTEGSSCRHSLYKNEYKASTPSPMPMKKTEKLLMQQCLSVSRQQSSPKGISSSVSKSIQGQQYSQKGKHNRLASNTTVSALLENSTEQEINNTVIGTSAKDMAKRLDIQISSRYKPSKLVEDYHNDHYHRHYGYSHINSYNVHQSIQTPTPTKIQQSEEYRDNNFLSLSPPSCSDNRQKIVSFLKQSQSGASIKSLIREKRRTDKQMKKTNHQQHKRRATYQQSKNHQSQMMDFENQLISIKTKVGMSSFEEHRWQKSIKEKLLIKAKWAGAENELNTKGRAVANNDVFMQQQQQKYQQQMYHHQQQQQQQQQQQVKQQETIKHKPKNNIKKEQNQINSKEQDTQQLEIDVDVDAVDIDDEQYQMKGLLLQ